MKKTTRAFTVVFILFLSGCSIISYETESSCKFKDNYGKCMSVEKSYIEAVTGVSQGPPIVKSSKKKCSKSNCNDSQEKLTLPSNGLAYSNYKDKTYQKLAGLIDNPRTPMLEPPKTIRTLVVSYSPNSNKETVYMPRYIYTIIQDPQWILGQYLNRKSDLEKEILN